MRGGRWAALCERTARVQLLTGESGCVLRLSLDLAGDKTGIVHFNGAHWRKGSVEAAKTARRSVSQIRDKLDIPKDIQLLRRLSRIPH